MATAKEDDKAKPRTGDGAGPAGSADIENPASVASLARRWRGEGIPEKAALPLRALGWLFSALVFLVMACNKHGDWRDFGKYQEYRYLVAASVLAFLYTTVQVVRQIYLLAGRKDALPAGTASTVDFAGDQSIGEGGTRSLELAAKSKSGRHWKSLGPGGCEGVAEEHGPHISYFDDRQ